MRTVLAEDGGALGVDLVLVLAAGGEEEGCDDDMRLGAVELEGRPLDHDAVKGPGVEGVALRGGIRGLIGGLSLLHRLGGDRAVAAGSRFIVSPGLNPKIVSYCLERDMPVVPGTSCPSDMEKALELGLDTVKFFPAEPSGGLKAIKAMAAPYTALSFMPTGGINAQNVASYLSYSRIVCCGGSWMVPGDLLKKGDFEGIRKLTEQAVLASLDLTFEPAEDGPVIRTLSVPRAKRYLASRGYTFAEGSSDTEACILAPIQARLLKKG